MAEFVKLVEMSPRDGLQNEASMISTADKVRLVDMLTSCGFQTIEVTSFVSPKWVPQLADAADVMARISRAASTQYAVLTPNLRGLEAALAAGADEVAIFASASEGFSQNNINCSIGESLARFAPVLDLAKGQGIGVRGYVSCVTDCPYDGPTPPSQVAYVADAMLRLGCFEISLGDTIGAAVPETVSAMLDSVLDVASASQLAGHFHDTGGRALDNIDVCLEAGLRVFDATAGGLGGCPYAPGAKGNVATEEVVNLLQARGFQAGIDTDKLAEATAFAKSLRNYEGATHG